MKLSIKKNKVSVTAENIAEALVLIRSYSLKTNNGYDLGRGTVKGKSKHKKHTFKKGCSVCSRPCKGAIGLAVHQRKRHNISGNNTNVVSAVAV